MNWTHLALITIGAGILTSLTDWFFAGDWLHRGWTYPEIWRQGVEARAIALTSPLPFLTCGVFSYVSARLGLHSCEATVSKNRFKLRFEARLANWAAARVRTHCKLDNESFR